MSRRQAGGLEPSQRTEAGCLVGGPQRGSGHGWQCRNWAGRKGMSPCHAKTGILNLVSMTRSASRKISGRSCAGSFAQSFSALAGRHRLHSACLWAGRTMQPLKRSGREGANEFPAVRRATPRSGVLRVPRPNHPRGFPRSPRRDWRRFARRCGGGSAVAIRPAPVRRPRRTRGRMASG